MNAFFVFFCSYSEILMENSHQQSRELILKIPQRNDSTTPMCASLQSMCRNDRLVPTAGLWRPLVVKVQRCTVKPQH